jgi:hypothetical protein
MSLFHTGPCGHICEIGLKCSVCAHAEASGRISELERDLATAHARVKELSEALEGLMRAHRDVFIMHAAVAFQAGDRRFVTAWRSAEKALSQPPTTDMWKPNTLSVPIDDKAMRDAVKKLEEDLTRGDLK